MGAREEFMMVRRAAQYLQTSKDHAQGEEVTIALTALLRKASAHELAFIVLHKQPFYAEVIDLAYAVMGERRPDKDAVPEYDRHATEGGKRGA